MIAICYPPSVREIPLSEIQVLTTFLDASTARTAKEIQEQNVSKHQAVFHLDFETWEDIIETFDIKKSIIPHRQSEQEAQIGASGWYG